MNCVIRWCGVALLLAVCSARAQQLPLWELGVFGGAAATPAYPGAAQRSTRALVLPFLIYRGDVVRVDQQGIGARLLRSERTEFDVGLAASLPAKSSDVPAREGMPDLGLLFELGPRLKVTLARPTSGSRFRLDLPLRAVIEARSGMRAQGWTFEPRIVYEANAPGERWTFDANLGMVFGDPKVNRYFYEVRPEFATPQRPAFEADSGLMLLRAGASASRMLGNDLRLFGYVRHESYAGAANRDSPLMQKRSGASAGFAFAWTITRSAQAAR